MDLDFRWLITQYEFAEDFVQSSHLDSVFTELEQHKLISDLQFIPTKGGIVQIRFKIQHAFRGVLNQFINEIRKDRYEAVCYESLDKNTNVMMQYVGIRARNSNFFKAYVNQKLKIWNADTVVAEYALDRQIYPWLQKMQEVDLIRNLQRTDNLRNAEIQFEFVGASNDTIRAMFDKTGTILELYAWHEALQQKCFYDIRPNFVFYWDDEAVSNELDPDGRHQLQNNRHQARAHLRSALSRAALFAQQQSSDHLHAEPLCNGGRAQRF